MLGLPPLQWLPALEAAARLGSFRAAADELHVTPSAVSQQIKALEEALGVRLFARQGRSVALTVEGERYAQQVRDALSELARASRRLQHRSEARTLRLHTTAFFAHELLIPAMGTFRERFKDVELRVETGMQLVDLHRSDVDAALRVGDGRWGSTTNVKIGATRSTPVCAPALADRLANVEDLLDQTLIEVRSSRRGDWNAYLRSKGKSLDPGRLLTFETYFETLRAAEQGLGVAWGVLPLTSRWLPAGRLCAPLPVRVASPRGLYLVHRPRDRGDATLAGLVEWLRAQYRALPRL